jgi:hypothetical protein
VNTPVAPPLLPAKVRRLACATALLTAAPVTAQQPNNPYIQVNSANERYLRLAQVAGRVPLTSWTIRPLGPQETERLASNAAAFPVSVGAPPIGKGIAHGYWVAPELRAIYNSSFPWGYNDGPVWAGRGLVGVASGGITVRIRPLTLIVAPTWFRAQNAGPTFGSNADTGITSFRDLDGARIDLPRRFGDGPYGRLDWGQSTIRLDGFGATLGVSSANQHLGPATAFPFLLGNNAAGIPNLFIGTGAPVNMGVGHVQGRMEWGRIDQTRWSPVAGEGRRLFTGVALSVTPRWFPGLEVGGARVIHLKWRTGGISGRDLFRALNGPLNDLEEGDNQLASVFFRWVRPQSGVEVFGEFGREDRNHDRRDLIVEPDHDAAYMVGLQKVFNFNDRTLSAVRAELLNTRITALANVRSQAPAYIQGTIFQGHTQLGQVLGAPGGAGGGAFTLSYEHHARTHSWSTGVTRLLGCGGTGGTGSCDAEAVELAGTHRRGVLSYTTGLSLISRRVRPESASRATGVSLSSGIRWENRK